MLHFLEELDAFRQRDRFADFLKACECDSRGRLGFEDCPLAEAEHLQQALNAALTVNVGAVAKQHSQPEQIKQAIAEARLAAIRAAMPAVH